MLFERRVPRSRPVAFQTVVAEQEGRVVELVGHVVEAAADVQGGLFRHDPDRVAGDAEAVPIAARERIEPGLGRVLLIEVRLELSVAGEHLPVVGDVHVEALRQVPVFNGVARSSTPPISSVRSAVTLPRWGTRTFRCWAGLNPWSSPVIVS